MREGLMWIAWVDEMERWSKGGRMVVGAILEPGRDGMVEHPIVTWRMAGWTGVGNGMRSKRWK